MKQKPIKRVEEMQSVSRDHHFALLLVFKIHKGIALEIQEKRIYNYILWFRNNHLLPHFKLEEKWMFPVLGNSHPKVQKALQELFVY